MGHAFHCDTAINAASVIPIITSTVHRMILNRFGEVGFILSMLFVLVATAFMSSMTVFVRLELTIGYQKHVAI